MATVNSDSSETQDGSGLTTFSVPVGNGERVRYSVHVDPETGLDICPHSGRLQTREETIANVQEVYAVGKDALGSDLERYNKWLAKNPDGEKKLFGAATRGPPKVPVEPKAPQRVEDLTAKAETWKTKGNALLAQKNYRGAISAYTKGLDYDSDNIALWANRSQANLNLKRYDRALVDAQKAIALSGGDHPKAAFREVLALQGMRRISEAHAAATAASVRFPSSAATWSDLIKQLVASPSLVLEAVRDTAELPDGSAGWCLVRVADSVITPDDVHDRLGTVPATIHWRAASEVTPALQSMANASPRLAAVPAALVQLAHEICAEPSPRSFAEVPVVATVGQHAALLGAGFHVGQSDHEFELVAAAVDIAGAFISDIAAGMEKAGAVPCGTVVRLGELVGEVSLPLAEFVAQVAQLTTEHSILRCDGVAVWCPQIAFMSRANPAVARRAEDCVRAQVDSEWVNGEVAPHFVFRAAQGISREQLLGKFIVIESADADPDSVESAKSNYWHGGSRLTLEDR